MAKPDQSAMLDQVAYLSEQAAAAAKDRKPGVISATFSAIGKMATTITAVSAAWNAAEPILKAHFGFP